MLCTYNKDYYIDLLTQTIPVFVALLRNLSVLGRVHLAMPKFSDQIFLVVFLVVIDGLIILETVSACQKQS